MAAIARKTRRAQVVLVVDGDASARDVYVAALKSVGYTVEHASTRTTALARAREVKPTLVVMDRELPDGDGWKIIAELRGIEGMSEVPVIALTAIPNKDSMTGSLVAGCDAFLEKPCEADVLVVQVKRLLALRSPRTTGRRKRVE